MEQEKGIRRGLISALRLLEEEHREDMRLDGKSEGKVDWAGNESDTIS